MINQYEFASVEQGSTEWLKARLGYISGSTVGELMKSGRSKDKEFSDTAMSRIYEIASRRMIDPLFLQGEGWEEYQRLTSINNKAIEFGKDCEPFARDKYQEVNRVHVTEVGFIKHPLIEWFGDSPDGLILNDKGIAEGAIEIKCPQLDTFVKYFTLLSSGASLKEVNADYYWQCLAHMEVNNASYVDFIVYNPIIQGGGYCQIRIKRTKEIQADIENMCARVIRANELVNQIVNQLKAV